MYKSDTVKQSTTSILIRILVVVLYTYPILSLHAQTGVTHEEHKSTVEHYHFSAFGGVTTNLKGKQGYKLGIEYEYRMSAVMGLGGTFDFTGADFDIFAFSLGTTFYPFDIPLVPALAIGAKSYDGHWDPFLRGLLAYDFHLENISLGPMLMYDAFPKHKNIISLGLSVGFSI